MGQKTVQVYTLGRMPHMSLYSYAYIMCNTSSYDMPSAWFVSKATSKCQRLDLLALLTNWPLALRCGFAHKPFASRHTIRTCWGLCPRTSAIVHSLNSNLTNF